MANTTVKQVDALGFDRMEIANVRRAYGANKVNYTKLNKLYEKAKALKEQIDAVNEAIKVWDAPARKLAVEKVGVELSSEEILIAHTEPEKFFQLHPELRRETVVEEMQEDIEAEVASIQAEEAEGGPEL